MAGSTGCHPAFTRGDSALLGELDASSFTQNSHADLAGVMEGVLDLSGNASCEEESLIIGNFLWLNHDAQLAAGLNRKAFFHTFEGHADLLEVVESLDVGGHGFRACAWA